MKFSLARGLFLLALCSVAALCLTGRWDATLHWLTGTLALTAVAVAWILVCDGFEVLRDDRTPDGG